jgi:hypothetical protein
LRTTEFACGDKVRKIYGNTAPKRSALRSSLRGFFSFCGRAGLNKNLRSFSNAGAASVAGFPHMWSKDASPAYAGEGQLEIGVLFSLTGSTATIEASPHRAILLATEEIAAVAGWKSAANSALSGFESPNIVFPPPRLSVLPILQSRQCRDWRPIRRQRGNDPPACLERRQ